MFNRLWMDGAAVKPSEAVHRTAPPRSQPKGAGEARIACLPLAYPPQREADTRQGGGAAGLRLSTIVRLRLASDAL
jgi:hypothetical protein